jgi:GxxExxY protein
VENDITERIIGAAIEVHRHLGPGLLEAVYEECLCYEFSQRGLMFQRQLAAPVLYKSIKLDCGYRIDLLVEDAVVVEIKSMEALLPVHCAQLLTYLKICRKRIGLLINFNVPILLHGLKRIANNFPDPTQRLCVSASKTSPASKRIS